MKKILIIFSIILVGMACKKDSNSLIVKAYEYINYSDIIKYESEMSSDQAISNTNSLDGQILKPSTVIIFKTSKGSFGKMRIISISPSPQYLLTFELVIYKNDGTVLFSKSDATNQITWVFDLDTGLQTADAIAADFGWNFNGNLYIYTVNSTKLYVYSK